MLSIVKKSDAFTSHSMADYFQIFWLSYADELTFKNTL